MSEASDRYGYPIVQDPRNSLYTNRMRAFNNRARRRNTRLNSNNRNYRRSEQMWERNLLGESPRRLLDGHPDPNEAGPSGTSLAESNHQQSPLLQLEQSIHIEREAEPTLNNEQVNSQQAANQQVQDQVQAQLESLLLRDHLSSQEQQTTGNGQEEQTGTEVLNLAENTENSEANSNLDASLAETFQALQNLEVGLTVHTDPMQVIPLQVFPPELEVEPSFKPLSDPQAEFDRSMLEDIQNKDVNDPSNQPIDYNPRWISIPEGGAVFTNARLSFRNSQEQPESNLMAKKRQMERALRRREEMQFELQMQMEEGNLSNVGNNLRFISMRNTQGDQQETSEERPQEANEMRTASIALGLGEEVNPRSPSFICTINE
ncbi:hypothetical protein COLO4_10410 [Corchorus olitorius]|uniref:Uncharacterized protein n=1 Tax=Corchorus olitorius TaxID=93759 RepID=A0A1R3K8R7_9ROSI|nr:hypothetical protein COLO4_10410 [Corchorus olitorius]